ncbi:MAG: PAS domain S-box protein [Dehalococcoidia bacterium]|nr:PAS domain S-box protein [Dehalococcoidia bacterium]
MISDRHIGAPVDRAIDSPYFPVGIFWGDTSGKCGGVNPRWCELSGLSAEESLGYGWVRAIHPDDRERVLSLHAQHVREPSPLYIEFRLLRPGGSARWVLSQSVALLDPSGQIDGFVGTVTDITSRVEAETALRESELRFRNLVEVSPDLIAIHRNGTFLYVNPAGLAMMAASAPSDIIGHQMMEFILPPHREAVAARTAALGRGEEIGITEVEVRRCDGEPIWVETVGSATVWEGAPATQLVARDVTERRRSAETYRSVVDGVRDVLWVVDRCNQGEWRVSLANRAYLKQLGFTSDAAVVGHSLPELVALGFASAPDVPRILENYDRAAATGRPVEYESTMTWNGVEKYFSTTITPIMNSSGPCTRLFCWSRDLSRKRERDLALARSEANYRAVVEGTSDAVWVFDRGADGQYRLALANQRSNELNGLDLRQGIGRTIDEGFPRGLARLAHQRIERVEEARRMLEFEDLFERAGRRWDAITSVTPVFDDTGRCTRIICSAHDVTDRRNAEMALAQAQKLDSLGVLAGGIAHDFNNLLTTILGNLYLLDGELPEDSPLRAYTEETRVAAERGADLVKRLLGFSRPGIETKQPVALRRLVNETVTLARRTLGPSITLDIAPIDSRALVNGEFSGLQQVLLNLLLNARDAMPGGGTISIQYMPRTIPPSPLWEQRRVAPGPYHELAINDTGEGMSSDVLQRIFDPFFTTKEVGKGTGLGLPTALGVVRAHGGWLAAESREGEGSRFRILLPEA